MLLYSHTNIHKIDQNNNKNKRNLQENLQVSIFCSTFALALGSDYPLSLDE